MLPGDRVRMVLRSGDDPKYMYGRVNEVVPDEEFPVRVRWDEGDVSMVGYDEIEVFPPSGLRDSGERAISETGFTKEPDTDRPDMTWVFEVEGLELIPREMIERLAKHYSRGAVKYSADNWRLGIDPESLTRLKRSAARHIFQWFRGDTDEDHVSAATFNLWAHDINKAAADAQH